MFRRLATRWPVKLTKPRTNRRARIKQMRHLPLKLELDGLLWHKLVA